MTTKVKPEINCTENLICSLCDQPGTFADANETAKIRAVVREFADEEYTVWRCNNCKSLHCKEAIDHEVYYKNYPLKSHILDFPTRCAYANRLRFLRRLGLKREHRILDHGCGGGAFVKFLQQKGYPHAVGFDPFCEQYANPEVLENSYDFVTSYEVIEHAEDPVSHFAELAKLTERNGYLIVGTPRADEIDLQDFRTYGVPLHQPHHRHILSKACLERLGSQHDLRVACISERFPFDTLWPALNWSFLKEYVYRCGSIFDVLFEKPRVAIVFSSPRLIFLAIFGYFVFTKENVVVAFARLKHR